MKKTKIDINSLPSINRRLYEFAIKSAGSIYAFSKNIELSQPRINSLFHISEKTGKYPTIQSDVLEAILKIYDLNTNWLYTGQGEMLDKPEAHYEIKPHLHCGPKMVPHIIDEYADCGKPNGFGAAIMEDRCPKYIIPGLSGHDFTIIARGRSMINRSCPEKSIRPGDIVGCKKWNSRSHLRWGEVYILSTPDGITIKQIQPSEKEGYIKCIPFNVEEHFQPFDMPVEEIYDWAIVVGVVSVMLWA